MSILGKILNGDGGSSREPAFTRLEESWMRGEEHRNRMRSGMPSSIQHRRQRSNLRTERANRKAMRENKNPRG